MDVDGDETKLKTETVKGPLTREKRFEQRVSSGHNMVRRCKELDKLQELKFSGWLREKWPPWGGH